MVDILAAQVTATIVKEWQTYGPTNDPAEHIRNVVVDLSIDAASNLNYPDDGIDLSGLFTSGNANDIDIDPNNIWFGTVKDGIVYAGANEAVINAFPASFDQSAQKLILRSVDATATAVDQGLVEGAISDPSGSTDVLTCRMFFIGRKRDI